MGKKGKKKKGKLQKWVFPTIPIANSIQLVSHIAYFQRKIDINFYTLKSIY